MATSEQTTSELATRLLDQVVRALPAVDIHTHILPTHPAAHSLEEVLFYHYIRTELETAGMNLVRLDRAGTLSEKILVFNSASKLISNTVTFWCLRRVLALYGVGEDFSSSTLQAAASKARAASSDPDWPRKVLVELSHIRKTFLTLNILEPLPSFDSRLFVGALRLDEATTTLSMESFTALEKVSGQSITDLGSYKQAVEKCLSAFAATGGRALTVGLLPEESFTAADRPAAEKLFEKVRRSDLTLPEREVLHSYLLRMFAGLARDFRLPFQILVGVRRPLPGNVAVPVVRSELVARYAPLFYQFSQVSFDLFLGSVPHSQELVAVAKNYPNVSLSGHWWYAFSPPYIRSMLTERILLLPAVKMHAFFSDAYNVEWSVGKGALLRRELAWVLADLIISGYLSESLAQEVAQALLYDNPVRFYGLSEPGMKGQSN